MNTNTTSRHRETADNDRSATWSGLAASAQRSLYVLEAELRNLSLKQRGGERLTADEASAFRAMPDRLRQQRAAVAELQRRASTKS